MERRSRPNHRQLPVEFLAQPKNTERYKNFLEFYRTHCFPANAPCYEIDGELREFPHLLTCGMTHEFQTIVLRSTDGPNLAYALISHDLHNGIMSRYDIQPDSPTFSQNGKGFHFGMSPLIMNIDATTTANNQPVHLELTSQSCLWTVDNAQHHLEDIYLLPSHVDHYRAINNQAM